MAKQLLSNLGKRGDSSYTTNGVPKGLDQILVDIEDTSHFSTYFRVVEFDPVFTAGKNSISFNGSDLLADGSEIKVEVLDSSGNSLYLSAVTSSVNYIDIANFTVAIYVYRETVSGAGTIILVGTSPKGEIVRWTGNITINTTYPNVSRVRFYNAPTMEITPLLYPVIESVTGSLIASSSFVSDTCNAQYIYRTGMYLVTTHNVFTRQMVGQPLMLNYGKSQLLLGEATQLGTYDLSLGRFGATGSMYIVAKVINSKTILLNSALYYTFLLAGQVIKNVIIMGMTGASFTMSYSQMTHIHQSTTVPCTAAWITDTPTVGLSGYMEVHANSNVFDPTVLDQKITMNYSEIKLDDNLPKFNPSIRTYANLFPQTSGDFIVRAVTGSRFIHTDSFNYTRVYGNVNDGVVGGISGNSVISHVYPVKSITGSVTFLSSSSPYQHYSSAAGSSSLMQKSYVDIIYRNVDTFTGAVSRHKLYAKSNIYPGDFNLIADSVVGPSELLIDQISANKMYATIGTFENQDKVNQYWFPSSASLTLVQSNDLMMSSMTIAVNPDYSSANGNSYVIAKTSAIELINDAIYYPFDLLGYEQFNGPGYASNFIFLAKNVLHILSSNVVVNKDKLTTAKISFYFTSSSPDISDEPNYIPQYGLKIGEIIVSDQVPTRTFSNVQQLFFTPLNDYYGTLVIVPYLCEVTIANLSIQNYGDHGFSPGAIEVQLPFPINVANESYTFKAELFDSNANLVYTIPPTNGTPVTQVFDPSGASLFGSNVLGSAGGSGGVPSTLPALTIQGGLYLPGIGQCPSPKRLLGFNLPTHHPPLVGEGSVCYTDVIELGLTASSPSLPTLDYLSLSTTMGQGKSVAVRYDTGGGRRIYVDPNGVKYTYL